MSTFRRDFPDSIAAVIFEGQTILANGARTLREHCVEGITANEDVLEHYVEHSIGTVTALNPVIGYELGAKIAKQAYAEKRPVRDVAAENTKLPEAELDRLLDRPSAPLPEAAE